MTTKTKVIISIVVVVVTSFSVGRYTVSETVRTETKIVEVEKKEKKVDTDVKKNTKKTTKKVIVVKPDGSSETTIVTDENTTTDKDQKVDETSQKNTDTDKSKEVVKGDSKLTISALGGIDLSTKKPVYGASIQKDVLGPINVGLFGLSNGTCGASIGIKF
jgi:hypothetical protein